MTIAEFIRKKRQVFPTGKVEGYAWPGGYPVLYLAGDGATLCPKCVAGEDECNLGGKGDPAWRLDAYFIHCEGPPEICAHCGEETESAYGNPWEED